MAKKLHRSNSQKVLGGVAGGIAEYFDIDPVIVRILFLIAIFGAGASIFIYIVMWIIIPVQPYMPEDFKYYQNDPPEAEPANSNESSHNNYQAENPKEESSKSLKLFFGIALIVIGSLSFLDQFLHMVNFKWLFPGLLIAIGIFMIVRTGDKNESI